MTSVYREINVYSVMGDTSRIHGGQEQKKVLEGVFSPVNTIEWESWNMMITQMEIDND